MTTVPPPAPADVLLEDGTIATVRPVVPEDHDELARLHAEASDESVRLRFFAAGRNSGREYVAHVTTSDRVLPLVAVQHGEVIGLATAEIGDGTAEIAFLVADRMHGRGVATLLLEHLAAWSHRLGIRRFTAEVLGENHRMLQVFTDAGFAATRGWNGEVVTWDLTTDESEPAVAAAEDRERVAEARSLRPLLYPRSVAIVGASRSGVGIGSAVLASVLAHDFTGSVYVVHPDAPSIAGVTAYPTLESIPDHVDVVMVAVPARQVPATVRQAAAAGCSTLVIISSGFGELGAEGLELQREVLEIARAHGIRLLGPNCLGLLCNDPSISLNATFSPVTPPTGGLAVASQSGGVGIALLDMAAERGLGVQHFVSLGNQPDVSGNDLLAAWRDDPGVTAAAFYVEGFGNSAKFARLARRFSERKPLLAVLGGRTSAGARGGASHTAAAATPAVAVEALFAQTGVISCRSAEELVRAAALITEQPLPAGRRVGIVSNAGGIGILAADSAERNGLRVPEFSTELAGRLEQVVNGTVGVTNPVDLGAAAGPEVLTAAAGAMLASGEIDTLLVAIVATSVTDPQPVLDAVAPLRDKAPAIPVVLVTMGGIRPADSSDPGSVTTYATPDEATEAIAHAAAYADWRDLPRDSWYELDEERAFAARRVAAEILDRRGRHWLEPAEQEALLGPYGIRPLGETVVGHLEAGAAARRIGYPVAVKVAGADVVHKTDRGLVRVGLTSSAEVVAAVRGFEDELNRTDVPVLVQPVAKGPELALGISRHPVFGPVVMVAAGGVATDLLADRAFLVPPLSRRDVARALRSLRMWPLLDGFRGAPLADTCAIEELVLQVGNLARDLPELAELDLNPVIATPDGPVVVDVKAHLRPAEESVGATPRQLSRPHRTPERRIAERRIAERRIAERRATSPKDKETSDHV